MASGDSGKATDSSNIGSTVRSYVEGATGSVAVSEVTQHIHSLGAYIWGATEDNAQQKNE
jgi:hypothetical protein